MKQFIVLAAIIPILLLFVMQLSLEQENHNRISYLQELVYSTKEQARQEGQFTKAMRDDLTEEVSRVFDVSKSEVLITCPSFVRYRGEIIEYSIDVPIAKLMAGNEMLGISDYENRGRYKIEGRVVSEKLEER